MITSAEDYRNKKNKGFFRNFENRAFSIPSKYNDFITKASVKHNVKREVILAIIKIESDFRSTAVSNKGAMGLMQLMPLTAAELGVVNVFDPEENINAGTKYLKQLLDLYDGNLPVALAAYNAGMGNVKKYNGIPPFKETKAYVKNVLKLIETQKLT